MTVANINPIYFRISGVHLHLHHIILLVGRLQAGQHQDRPPEEGLQEDGRRLLHLLLE